MDIQVLKIRGEEYVFLPRRDFNKLVKPSPRNEREWYGLDEICEELGVSDRDVEFTVSQVADILAKKPLEIHRLIKAKTLKAQKQAGRYVINKQELKKYRNGIE